MANMSQMAKSPSKAIKYRKKALELAPADVDIINNFALDVLQMGQIEKGVSLLKVRSSTPGKRRASQAHSPFTARRASS